MKKTENDKKSYLDAAETRIQVQMDKTMGLTTSQPMGCVVSCQLETPKVVPWA